MADQHNRSSNNGCNPTTRFHRVAACKPLQAAQSVSRQPSEMVGGSLGCNYAYPSRAQFFVVKHSHIARKEGWKIASSPLTVCPVGTGYICTYQ